MNFSFRPLAPADRSLIAELQVAGGGAAIRSSADAQAKELDLAYLHLEVTETNTRARQIYERRGFAPTGHMLMSKRTTP